MRLNQEDFGKDFKWGTSTAAYQIEGAYNTDGKGKSIWDVFTATKGKIRSGDNGNTACDFYHKYAQDISLVAQLNIPNFRFSLSWSRIMPCGAGPVNLKGIDFYNKVIDFCLDIGVEPWITIYHWDLPYELEKKGGWTNRNIINWFSDYVAVCIKHFGDRVKHWIVLNEPMAFTGAGYFLGIHAPGRKGLSGFLAAVHHAAMCQSIGGQIIKSLLPSAKVGTTFSCSYIQPYRQTEKDKLAATRIDALLNRLFAEPLAGLGYPIEDLKFLQRLEPYIRDGDEKKLAFDMDFIGVQNYTRELVKYAWCTPMIQARLVKADKRKVATTEMNWEIYPECIYEMLKKFSNYTSKEIIVTENGAAFPDVVIDNEVNDEQRKNYLQQHIKQVLRAKQEGVNVNGYFVWSFTDNFEWAEGYAPRFGLVHVDFLSQKRTVKASGNWYKQFLKSRPIITKTNEVSFEGNSKSVFNS
jgi:beta-glucosidase